MAQDRRQRRDAAANRERILTAAGEAFRRAGMAVDMRAVATAAGVGVGTLYRHFPTREHLVHAVTGADLAALARVALPAGATSIDALRTYFTAMLTALAGNRAMVDVLAAGPPTGADLERCRAHLTAIGRDAVERSRTDGALAPDVTAEDVAHQFLGLVRIVQLLPDAGPVPVAHQVDLALRALAAPGPWS
ncbi:TetR/AcrR family transcriptional regulator [Streptomyces sp. LE64]|uniref:TetR/AcrR family transcriptional regulator n=1 Tax=unclassified Streptomyces TaxID=2593676 RepID=UPI00332F0963